MQRQDHEVAGAGHPHRGVIVVVETIFRSSGVLPPGVVPSRITMVKDGVCLIVKVREGRVHALYVIVTEKLAQGSDAVELMLVAFVCPGDVNARKGLGNRPIEVCVKRPVVHLHTPPSSALRPSARPARSRSCRTAYMPEYPILEL